MSATNDKSAKAVVSWLEDLVERVQDEQDIRVEATVGPDDEPRAELLFHAGGEQRRLVLRAAQPGPDTAMKAELEPASVDAKTYGKKGDTRPTGLQGDFIG